MAVLPSSTVVAAQETDLRNVTSISISSASKRFSFLHISQKVETHLAFLMTGFFLGRIGTAVVAEKAWLLEARAPARLFEICRGAPSSS